MGKNRRDRGSSGDKSDKKRKPVDPDDDSLGKLLQQYQVTLAGVLLVSGVVLLIGLGILAYALTRQPYSIAFLLVGTAVLLFALVLLGMNVFNVGRRLELRKLGVRFVEFGISTEMFWDEIEDIAINRTDDTYLGVASVRRRSTDASSPSGLLTNTEWDVTIQSHDGRTIRLRPMFLRTVPDPKSLIGQLRMRVGLR